MTPDDDDDLWPAIRAGAEIELRRTRKVPIAEPDLRWMIHEIDRLRAVNAELRDRNRQLQMQVEALLEDAAASLPIR
jgi:hypothetical protein